jgi:hypothetical protein
MHRMRDVARIISQPGSRMGNLDSFFMNEMLFFQNRDRIVLAAPHVVVGCMDEPVVMLGGFLVPPAFIHAEWRMHVEGVFEGNAPLYHDSEALPVLRCGNHPANVRGFVFLEVDRQTLRNHFYTEPTIVHLVIQSMRECLDDEDLQPAQPITPPAPQPPQPPAPQPEAMEQAHLPPAPPAEPPVQAYLSHTHL